MIDVLLRVGLFFMDLGFLGNMTKGSAVLMLYDKSPSSHWDLHKLFDIQLNEHKINVFILRNK